LLDLQQTNLEYFFEGCKKINIAVLFGDDDNYFEKLDKWFNNSL